MGYLDKILNKDGTTSQTIHAANNKIWTAGCLTPADTPVKVVTLDDPTGFSLTTGVQIAVRFTYGNATETPILNVNETGQKTIAMPTTASEVAIGNGITYNTWGPYETIIFTYNGTYWVKSASSLGAYLGQSGTSGYILQSNGTNPPTWVNTVPVAHGGTGVNQFTANSIIMSGATATDPLTTRTITNNTTPTAIGQNINIPTMNTIYNGLAQINGGTQNRNINIYAPINGGTSYYLLQSNGADSIPSWVNNLGTSTSRLNNIYATTLNLETNQGSNGIYINTGNILVGNGNLTLNYGNLLVNGATNLQGNSADGYDSALTVSGGNITSQNYIRSGSRLYVGYNNSVASFVENTTLTSDPRNPENIVKMIYYNNKGIRLGDSAYNTGNGVSFYFNGKNFEFNGNKFYQLLTIKEVVFDRNNVQFAPDGDNHIRTFEDAPIYSGISGVHTEVEIPLGIVGNRITTDSGTSNSIIISNARLTSHNPTNWTIAYRLAWIGENSVTRNIHTTFYVLCIKDWRTL